MSSHLIRDGTFRPLTLVRFTINFPKRKAALKNYTIKDLKMHSSLSSSGLISTPISRTRRGHSTALPASKNHSSLFNGGHFLVEPMVIFFVVILQIRKQRKYDYNVFDESVFIWEASCGEGGNGIREI